ncbi:synaptotagmin-10-like [Babylonia areolata]|uniref:synaptotagmin-10-like n=1 Tax=Babylonia areolata TaxID=304850 RepID=UPI003FD0EF4D
MAVIPNATHRIGGLDPLSTFAIASGSAVALAVILLASWLLCRRRRKLLTPYPGIYPGIYPEKGAPYPREWVPDTGLRISKSSPDISSHASLSTEASPTYGGGGAGGGSGKKRVYQISGGRQWTLPAVPQRHLSFQRMLSHRLDLSNIQFSVQSIKHKEQPELGAIKPELYKQASVDSLRSEHTPCGKLFFSLQYRHEDKTLSVTISRAENLPAKDFSGTSDPYVKVYLMPDRKNKHQTKVHRKTLNPEFNETFTFTVTYEELSQRVLQFSIYDFDRFSRHDLIGAVKIKDILGEGSLAKETFFVRDIYAAQQEKADIGEVMLSLCYLPTAGRLTLTVVKARGLKAMDITGNADPYVKVSLMCQGKRIKKRKTSVQKNTLHPVFNEALVFDVPQESVEDIYLLVKVVDYDRIGSDELMGSCGLGPMFNGQGRDHWYEMLENSRKPVAQWYPLLEHLPLPPSLAHHNGKCCLRQRQSTEDSTDSNLLG